METVDRCIYLDMDCEGACSHIEKVGYDYENNRELQFSLTRNSSLKTLKCGHILFEVKDVVAKDLESMLFAIPRNRI